MQRVHEAETCAHHLGKGGAGGRLGTGETLQRPKLEKGARPSHPGIGHWRWAATGRGAGSGKVAVPAEAIPKETADG